MGALTNADRQFLRFDVRWVEAKRPEIAVRHPGAREAEYASAFVSIAGASLALHLIDAMTTKDRRLAVAICDGLLPITFRNRPMTVLVLHRRFGLAGGGRPMLVERCVVDYDQRTTALYLTG